MKSPEHTVLIIGVGSIGERHARCFLRTGRATVGIVEPNESIRAAVAERYAIKDAYASLDEALSGELWTTAVICTPAQTHIQIANQCLDTTIPVLIEKPLAIETREAALLMECEHLLPIGVAYVLRAHPALAAMRQAIIDGRFGRPLQLIGTCGQHFPTYRPAYASTYYTQHKTGGGAIQDALTHMFNASEWFVGPITRIAVDARHLVLPDVEVEDTVNALAHHGEVMASYAYNQHQAPNEMFFTVVCERGTVRLEMHNSRWRSQTDPLAEWTDHPYTVDSRDMLFITQAQAWLDTVEGKAPPLCTLGEGYQTLAVNEAALWSASHCSVWRDVSVESTLIKEPVK
jgi:predicted dehydrogenase